MKKKNDLVPFDYVSEQIGLAIDKMSKKVCLDCAVEISFFILGQALLDHEKTNFREMVSLIEQGVNSSKKQKNKRKVG